MTILIISNLYPNRLAKNRAPFNRRQFFELSRRCSIKIIAQVAWTDKVTLKRSTGQTVPYQETIDGIETFHPTYYFIPKVLESLYGLFCFLSIYATASRQIRTMQPDCIFATWAYPDGFAAVLLGFLYRIPVFIKTHGSDIHSIQSRLRKILTAWGLNKARKVFSVSGDMKNKMVKMGVDEDRIITIYNGIDHTVFYPRVKTKARKKFNIPLDRTVMLFVGNLEMVKGPDVLIRAFHRVKPELTGCVLYLTGEGSQLKYLKKKCSDYGLGKSVIFSGPVAHEEMGCLMNTADLLIVPSRNEGVPNVILEAMACQIPVVATRVGGIPEVVVENQTGLLVESENPTQLGNVIKDALRREWNKDTILKHSKQYTWDKNISAIFHCIQKNI